MSRRAETLIRDWEARLHANELPWRAPLDASEAGLNRYPEPHPHQLAARLAALYGVDAAAVLPCRGSDEAIDLLTRAYCRDGRDAVLITPPLKIEKGSGSPLRVLALVA